MAAALAAAGCGGFEDRGSGGLAAWREEVRRHVPPRGRGPSSAAASPFSAGRQRVYLHACGRLEAVAVDSVTVSEVRAVARLAFDFVGDQGLVLVDKNGSSIVEDDALRHIVSLADTVYVQPSDGTPHEARRNIDQPLEPNIGFLCDGLAASRQEVAELCAQMESMKTAFRQECGAWKRADDAMRCEVEELRSWTRKQFQIEDKRFEELQRSLKDEAFARERTAQDLAKKCMETRSALGSEAKAREHGDFSAHSEIEELRRSIQLEVTDREDSEVRTERGLRDARDAVEEAAEASSAEISDLRRQVLDLQELLAREQRDRAGADVDLAGSLKDLRSHVERTKSARIADDADFLTRVHDLDMSLEAEQRERAEVISELTHRLSEMAESIQDERGARVSQGNDLCGSVDALRDSVDESRRRVEAAEAMCAKAAHELACRLDAEARAWRDTFGKESMVSADGDRRLLELEERLDAQSADLRAERDERTAAVGELTDRIHQQSLLFADERQQVACRFEETSALVGQQGQQITDERRERAGVIAELARSLQEARAAIDGEAQVRERALAGMAQGIGAAQEAMRQEVAQQQGALQDRVSSSAAITSEQIRSEALEATDPEFSALREGLAKVVEALQQERRSRSDADAKLREDFRDALQRVIDERVEQDELLKGQVDGEAHRRQEAIENETRQRQEVVEVVRLAIEELRQGLETHTHEFDDLEDAMAPQ